MTEIHVSYDLEHLTSLLNESISKLPFHSCTLKYQVKSDIYIVTIIFD